MKIVRYLSWVVIASLCILSPLTSQGHGDMSDGVYAGAGLGFDSFRINQTAELFDSTGDLINVSTSMRANGLSGKVVLGYGQYFCWFYFAGELFAKYSTAETSFNTLNYASDLSIRTSLGASLIQGIRISPCTLIYGRLGVDRTMVKVNEKGTILGSDSRRDWANGVDIGIGIERVIYPQVSFRVEYIFANFGAFRTKLDTKFSLKGNELALDFIYHFPFCF